MDIYIIKENGAKREVNFEELNQLKKDILWIYDQNIGDINCAFVPSYSFTLKYWEYLTLNGDKWFYEEDKVFYKEGTLIILLCFCVEYIDLEGGNQSLINRKDLSIIIQYVQAYDSRNQTEEILKNRILLGLEIIISINEEQLYNKELTHEKVDDFYKGLNDLGDYFILNYYNNQINKRAIK